MGRAMQEVHEAGEHALMPRAECPQCEAEKRAEVRLQSSTKPVGSLEHGYFCSCEVCRAKARRRAAASSGRLTL